MTGAAGSRSYRERPMTRIALLTALAVVTGSCLGTTQPAGPLPLGTWGGDNAGVIVSDTALHAHLGCTYGNAPRPSLTDGRFEVAGLFNITAYPVDAGLFHPAVFRGQVNGLMMSLTVVLSDTDVTLGPALVQLGREPRMGPCPICRPASDSVMVK